MFDRNLEGFESMFQCHKISFIEFINKNENHLSKYLYHPNQKSTRFIEKYINFLQLCDF